MKKFLLGSVALAAMLAGPAMAADMPVKAPPPPVYYDWSGIYLGFSVGWMWNQVDHHYVNAPPGVVVGGVITGSDFSTNSDRAAVDVHFGVQGQWGQWVLGVEGAVVACEQECRSTTSLVGLVGFGAATTGVHTFTNLYTAGVRLGWAWDRWLFYVNGGGAAGSLHGQFCNAAGICGPSVFLANGTSWNTGYYAGVGIDYMIHKGTVVDAIVGLEYQHYDLGQRDAFCNFAFCGASGADYQLRVRGDSLRARFTIKTHGWDIFYAPAPAPVVTK